MKHFFLGLVIFFALTACDGANDTPPPAASSNDPAQATGGQVCTQEAKICKDGSLAMITAGSCEQKCAGE